MEEPRCRAGDRCRGTGKGVETHTLGHRDQRQALRERLKERAGRGAFASCGILDVGMIARLSVARKHCL